MKDSPSLASLQSEGCSALINSALCEEDRATIAAEGGIEVLVAALEQHSGDAVLQEEACEALKWMCMDGIALSLSFLTAHTQARAHSHLYQTRGHNHTNLLLRVCGGGGFMQGYGY